ncbi:MAG: type II toxin-antitoxin system VapB family antitoxin [Thermoanaerobaculia bacterium]|nr:type II toxin-antitoxin system VapB family antitoxin [Thermoanaerobaculia bacterium]
MQPQLSVRSAKARDLAHRLARAEGRTIASVVERALEAYARRHGEPAEGFYQRLSRLDGGDQDGPDLAELIETNRRSHPGLDL